jgi:hypothetical protein
LDKKGIGHKGDGARSNAAGTLRSRRKQYVQFTRFQLRRESGACFDKQGNLTIVRGLLRKITCKTAMKYSRNHENA